MKIILYVAIAIIWFIYNAYQAIQKKQAQNLPEPKGAPDASDGKDIKTILEEMLLGKPENEKKTIPHEINLPENNENDSSRKVIVNETLFNKEEFNNRNKKQHNKQPNSLSTTDKQITEKKLIILDEEGHPVVEDFDAKKALIFSEIINKPKYLDNY